MRLSTATHGLVMVLGAAIPFNGIHPFLPIGELQRDAFFFASVPLTLLGWLAPPAQGRGVNVMWSPMLALMLVWMAIATILNQYTIQTLGAAGTSGISKAITGSAVVLYYFLFATALYRIVGNLGVRPFIKSFTAGLITALLLAMAVMVAEVLSWTRPELRDSVRQLRNLISDNYIFTNYRLFGVSYEPSFNAFFLLLSVPWVWYLAGGSQRAKRWMYLLLVLCMGALVISGARTAQIGLLLVAGYVVGQWLLRKFIGRSVADTVMAIGLVAFPVAWLAAHFALEDLIIGERSVSNISRSASVQAAILMGLQNPFFGVGIGQFGIRFAEFMPQFAWSSWEVVEFVGGEREGFTVPSYNQFSLIFAEAGLPAFLIFLLLIFSQLSRVQHFQRQGIRNGHDVRILRAVELSIVLAVAVMLSIGSFRLPHLWLSLVLAAATTRSALWMREASPTPVPTRMPPHEGKLAGAT